MILCVYTNVYVGVRFEEDRLSEAQEPCFLSLMLQFSNVSSIAKILIAWCLSHLLMNLLFYKCFQSSVVV